MAKKSHIDFSRMSPSERVELAQDLWDSVDQASDTGVVPLTDEQRAELDERLTDLDQPAAGSTWPEVKKRVLDKLPKGRQHKRGA